MAAAEGQSVCPFPLPPVQYYKLYSDDSVEKGLVPDPPHPLKGSYTMFGASFETDDAIIQSLETQGISRLYPKQDRVDRIPELKKLNCSILVNFLELLDILIKSPSSSKRELKIEDIKLLFINMHHLINELRPHQARETLRVMMERQKQQRLETANKLQKHIDMVVCLLQSASLSLQTVTADQEDSTEADMEVIAKVPSLSAEGASDERSSSVTPPSVLNDSQETKEPLVPKVDERAGDKGSKNSPCSRKDHIMCNILENLT